MIVQGRMSDHSDSDPGGTSSAINFPARYVTSAANQWPLNLFPPRLVPGRKWSVEEATRLLSTDARLGTGGLRVR